MSDEAREPSGGERFVVLDCNAAVVRGWLDGGHRNDYASGLFDTSFDPPRVVAEDGGEPEDQSFARDWRWVPRELNDLARLVAERDAEIARLRDCPELDCTDATHPAWWRGHGYATAATARRIQEALDGKDDPRRGTFGFGLDSLNQIVDRINELRRAETALADARAEVERLVELLESVEWMQPMSNSSPACPRCDGQQHQGHQPYCPLDKRLKQARDARARLAGEKGGG